MAEFAPEVHAKDGFVRSDTIGPGDSASVMERSTTSNRSGPHESEHEFGVEKKGIIQLDFDDDDDRKLFQPPFARQYFVDKSLYRESKMRKVTFDELFLDLVYVASFNRVGHLMYSPDWTQLGHFFLVFFPLWNSWQLFQTVSNRFGENTYQKLFVWLTIVLVAVMGISSENVFPHADDGSTAVLESTANLFIGPFLLFRALVLLYFFIALYYEPQFIRFALPQNVSNVLTSIPWFVSLFTADSLREPLWWTSVALEYTLFFGIVIFSARFKAVTHRYALNIEHHVERMGLLTIVVLGEVVIGFLFTSTSPRISSPFAVTVFGILIACSIQFLYFNIDAKAVVKHAIRRSMYTGILWNLAHLPLHASIIGLGAAMAKILKDYAKDQSTKVKEGQRYAVAFGAGLVILLLTAIAATNVNHDRSCRMRLPIRLGVRVLAALALMMLAVFGGDLRVIELFGTVVGIIVPLVVFEEVGRLRVLKRKDECSHAAAKAHAEVS